MTLNEGLTLAAIFLGPISALIIQRELDRRREVRNRRQNVFRTIWATRTFPQRLQYRHVEALNMVGIDFVGVSRVTDAWEEYLDKLNTPDVPQPEQTQFWRERDAKFHALIFEMSRHLRYKFTRLEVEKQFYTPQAHGTWAEQETVLREGITRLFKQETALPIRIVGEDATSRPSE
jgi:hypothetical protein